MEHFVRAIYPKPREIRIRKNAKRELSRMTHSPDPELSAIVIELTKPEYSNEYKLVKILTNTKIYAENLSSEEGFELIQFYRYLASIRALEYNCNFLHKLISLNKPNYLENLSSLSFTYRNEKAPCALSSSCKRDFIMLTSFNICEILQESINVVLYFQKKLNTKILSNNIKTFDELYHETQVRQENKIKEASIFKDYLNSNEGKKFLKYASNKITDVDSFKR